jgi:hypothetical protein
MRAGRFRSVALLLVLFGVSVFLPVGCTDETRTTGTLAPENEDVKKGMEASAAHYLKNSPVGYKTAKTPGQ